MKYAIIAILMMPALLTAADVAGYSIEAENFDAKYDIDIDAIRTYRGELLGLSYVGEWTEYAYSISAFGSRSAVMYARGLDGISYHVRLTLTPDDGGDAVTVDFQFTGSGCG
jgi:hypothetical protein